TSGEARELPGFLVGTADVGLDPLTGFHSPSLFSGEVGVGGYYGLQVMPEPATLALLSAGVLRIAASRRRRWHT
ncbi:MAG: PEP-CTERM sorting domain-containing protein, partial [Phycisphaerae bacterium]